MVRKEIYSFLDGINGDNQGELIFRTTSKPFCNKRKSFYGNNDKFTLRNVLMNFQSMSRKFLIIISHMDFMKLFVRHIQEKKHYLQIRPNYQSKTSVSQSQKHLDISHFSICRKQATPWVILELCSRDKVIIFKSRLQIEHCQPLG